MKFDESYRNEVIARRYWNNVACDYDSLYQGKWSKYEDQLLGKILVDVIGNIHKTQQIDILDVGCGTGLVYELLLANKIDTNYLGVDISPAMLENFNIKHPHVSLLELSVEDLSNLYGRSKFDFIISTNVSASYFADIQNFFDQSSKLLKNNGRFIFSVLNRYSLRKLTRLKFGSSESYQTRGIFSGEVAEITPVAHSYTSMEMSKMLIDSGFRNINTIYQSILGGVIEHKALIPVEKILIKRFAQLGHSFYCVCENSYMRNDEPTLF